MDQDPLDEFVDTPSATDATVTGLRTPPMPGGGASSYPLAPDPGAMSPTASQPPIGSTPIGSAGPGMPPRLPGETDADYHRRITMMRG
jgi:hypothetical protein